MSTCETQVLISSTECNVIEVCTPGPQGPTGPMGNPGPTGPASGPTGPTGPVGPSTAPVFNAQVLGNVPSGTTDNFSPFLYVGGVTNCLLLNPADGTSTLAGLSATGVPPGFSLLLVNTSSSFPVQFLNVASGTPANQFACPSGATFSLLPFSTTLAVYISNQWFVA